MKPHPLVGEVVHDTVIDTFLPPGLNLGSAFSSDIKAEAKGIICSKQTDEENKSPSSNDDRKLIIPEFL